MWREGDRGLMDPGWFRVWIVSREHSRKAKEDFKAKDPGKCYCIPNLEKSERFSFWGILFWPFYFKVASLLRPKLIS